MADELEEALAVTARPGATTSPAMQPGAGAPSTGGTPIIHNDMDRVAESEPLADRAVRDFVGVVPDDFPGRGIALAVRGHCRLELGRAREALPDMLEADRVLLPRFGPDNPRTKELHARIKQAYTKLGMAAEAARW